MKYGIKSIWRTPIKSILFCFMLTMVILFLSLGIGMWSVAEGMLEDADKVFLTAGEFTYTGSYDANAYDNNEALVAAYDELMASGILSEEEIIYWEEQKHQKAIVDGYTPNKWSMINLETMFLTIKVQYYMSDYEGYVALVTAAHYSEDCQVGTLVFLPQSCIGRELEKGEKLLVLAKSGTVQGMAFEGLELLPLKEGDSFPLLVNITETFTEEDFFATEDGQLYRQKMETFRAENFAQDLIATGKVETVTAFHIGEYTLMEGSFFTAEDYVQGNACLVPKQLATSMEKGIGDTIHLKVYEPVTGKGINHCYEGEEDVAYEGDFVIRGIYQAEERGTPIYLTDAGQEWLGRSDNDYVLGRVVLNNRTATDYCEQLMNRLPESIMLTANNEGYDASVQSIHGLLRTARILTVTTFLITLLIAGIFRYFFVSTNKDNMKILLQLGTNEAKTMRFFLSGSGVICLISVVCGCTIGYLVAGKLIGRVFDNIVQNSVYDFRFSVNGYGVKSATFEPTPNLDGTVLGIVGVSVLVLLLLWCAVGIWRAIIAFRPGRIKDKVVRAKVFGASANTNKCMDKKYNAKYTQIWDKLPGVSLRYSLRNIYRQGAKSLIVPILLMVLLTFLCVFTHIRNNFAHELQHVYENVPVSMHFTDISGRKMDDLVIYQKTIDEVEATGFVEESWKSTTYYARFMGVPVYSQETELETTYFYNPYVFERLTILSNFAWETMKAQWKSAAEPLQIAETLSEAPGFKYEGVPQIKWLEGMSEEGFLNNQTIGEREEYGCLVPDYYLDKYGLALGDLIVMAVPYSYDYDFSYNVVRIAGVYSGKSTEAALFMTPEAFEASIVEAVYIKWPRNDSYIGEKWSSAGANLKNTEKLSEFKDWLENHYDPIGTGGRYRQWLLIDDKALYDTIDNLTRYIEYMKLLYPVLIALIIAIAFLVSNLLLKNRLQEMAMLRSMGCSKGRVFTSIFVEYLILSLVGILLGLFISYGIIDGKEGGMAGNTAALLLCYYLGAIAAIMNSFRKTLILALKQKEE